MVKELKKKFIKTTMLVVSLLMVVFLAAVNILNYSLTKNDIQSTLNRIVEQNLRSIPGGVPEDGMGPNRKAEDTDNGRTQSFGRYFVVRVNASGAVGFHDLSHDPEIDYDGMVALIHDADVKFAPEVTGETETEPAMLEQGNVPLPDERITAPKEERGQVDGYLYYAMQQMDGSVAYAFLDISQETEAMIRIVLITIALGVALWFLILLFVVFLSKKAIVPIAENIEKQRQFITNAGHEIKTPLAVILSNVDVLELHEGKSKWTENIRNQALRLSSLTKQMLTLAKMEESGTAAFTSSTFDASGALEEIIRIFQENASLRGIDIQTEIEPGVMIHFPKDQYQQMLELLLDNAVKYGKENGFLFVSLRTERKMVRLSFQNDCDMLPDVDPDQLFDRFYRSDASRSRQTGGSGIGLAVVRAIAEQGGGSAQAHFRSGQVIEFVIEIPRTRS